jgi:hypothetical protein
LNPSAVPALDWEPRNNENYLENPCSMRGEKKESKVRIPSEDERMTLDCTSAPRVEAEGVASEILLAGAVIASYSLEFSYMPRRASSHKNQFDGRVRDWKPLIRVQKDSNLWELQAKKGRRLLACFDDDVAYDGTIDAGWGRRNGMRQIQR